MIRLCFHFGNEEVSVIVEKTNVLFNIGGMHTTIKGLKLSKSGVIKEFPDLKNRDDWADKAKERFTTHINKLKSEIARAKYIKEDLSNHGYKFKFYQRAGFRPSQKL